MPFVLNARTVGKSAPNAVYIGRPGAWGNPFVIGKDGDREEVIRRYKLYLENNPDVVAKAREELAGKDLICWCAPLACHGHILMEVANGD